jgi:hypothetical protein
MSKFCTSCGTKNINEAKFCRSCGQALEDASNNGDKQENIKTNIKKAKKESKVTKEIDYSKIGGWLILYGVMLIFGIIASLQIITEYTNNFVIDFFYSSQNKIIISDYNMLVLTGMLHLFFISFVALNFFTKHPKTRLIVILFSVISLITTTVSISLSMSLSAEKHLDAEFLPKMMGSILWTITWLLYFIFSKRVKKTFININSNEKSNKKMIIFALVALLIPIILMLSFGLASASFNVSALAESIPIVV